MSNSTIQTFGETLRLLREQNKMALRELAALLNLDQSTLSKIERNERKANSDLIERVSKLFKVNKKELQLSFLSDQIAYKVIDEKFGVEVLQIAEHKITYLKNKKNDGIRNT